MAEPPSYHDLHVTTPEIPRRPIFDLPFGLMVTCSRAGGWGLSRDGLVIAGEYGGPDAWLVLDVAGHVICDGRDRPSED
jgi:hypothetical protein